MRDGPIFEISVTVNTKECQGIDFSLIQARGYIKNEGSDESLIFHHMLLMAAVSSGRDYGR